MVTIKQGQNVQNIKNNATFGQRLRKLRKDMGLNQTEFAKKLGFSANTIISRFEKDKSLPTIETLIKLAEGSNVDIHWLLTGRISPSGGVFLNKLHEVLNHLAPYVGSELTRLFEKKAELVGTREGLSKRRLEDKETQAVRLELLDKDIAKVQEYINQTVKDLDYIQNPFGDGSSAQKTIKELEGVET